MNRRFIVILFALLLSSFIYAGNDQRAGQAGASELLINPWARSSGFGGANSASIHGLEAIYLNVAGTAFTRSTELLFSHSNWLVGTDIAINSFGFSQKVGETGVLSLALMSMDFGDIQITTVDLPEGGLGTFHPHYTNINLAYAKAFSNSIYGGINFKIINESISDLSAGGVAIDAGIQYVTGFGSYKIGDKTKRKTDNLMFGISMKNVGPTMKFKGDGMSFTGTVPAGVTMTVEQRSADFELPSLIKIGFSYKIPIVFDVDTIKKERNVKQELTIAGTFTSNSFIKDQYSLGLEYNFKNIIMVRAGYVYEKGLWDYETRTTAFTGPTAGLSVQIPLNKEKGSVFAIEYSYRDTDPFSGVHSIGARITL
ncbi:MAG TPA: PorV/PorQ family protein [Bacteroidales bacterium]|nr:PorV/PorQ family protein [Bacteroidales bacterium]